jgi:hypothetical protein
VSRIASACVLAAAVLGQTGPVRAQEARRRWETMCQIRKDKFDYVCLMNFCSDVKRMAHVLEHGEGKPPAGSVRC